MMDINEMVKLTDKSKLLFYIENNQLIIDLYRKRGLCVSELEKEDQRLRERYKDITGKEYSR